MCWSRCCRGAFLTFAIVIGEFTMASLLNRPAFGPYLQLIGANRAYEPAALAIIAFAITWACMGADPAPRPRRAAAQPPTERLRTWPMALPRDRERRRSPSAPTTVVQDFDLAVERGEFVSFLGPSGCGKTTTLRMVAGFEAPTAGTIRIDGKDVTGLQPNQRNVGMVFQSYALFPNMTVAENVAFGLKVAEAAGGRDRRRGSRRCSSSSSCRSSASRYPYQLSGGQQQRVALARALRRQAAGPAARRAALGARRQDPRLAARGDPRASSASSASPRST